MLWQFSDNPHRLPFLILYTPAPSSLKGVPAGEQRGGSIGGIQTSREHRTGIDPKLYHLDPIYFIPWIVLFAG